MKMEEGSGSKESKEESDLIYPSNTDKFSDASSALGSALICISKCEALLKNANEEKILVSIFCQIKTIKDSIGK